MNVEQNTSNISSFPKNAYQVTNRTNTNNDYSKQSYENILENRTSKLKSKSPGMSLQNVPSSQK